MPSIKVIAIICFVWISAVLIYFYLGRYLAGYLITDRFLSWSVVLGYSLLIAFCVLFAMWIVSILLRKDWLWTTGLVLGVPVLAVIAHVLPGAADLEMYGLRDRLLHDATLDDLRNFARDFDQQIPHAQVGLEDLSPRQAAVLQKLQEKYPSLWRFTKKSNIGPYMEDHDGIVSLLWGRYDEYGQWGVSISAHGGNHSDHTESPPLRVSDDIFFYTSE